jgi:SAM-dependent methyltransferase
MVTINGCSKPAKTSIPQEKACLERDVGISPGPLLEKEFTYIYDTAKWGCNSAGEGSSGYGSSIESTKLYVALLEDFIQTHNIKSVVDVGCGDWEFSRHINWGNASYVGFDVVQRVINKNIRSFARPHIAFICANALETDLPTADLLICKDMLQHLPNNDILAFFKQLPKFKYCLITNDIDPTTFTSMNYDIELAGHWRTIDLTTAPFNIKAKKILTYLTHSNNMKQVLLIERI